MNKDEMKKLIKEYIKENLTVDIIDSTKFESYTETVRVVISIEDEEITSSEVFIEHPQLRFG